MPGICLMPHPSDYILSILRLGHAFEQLVSSLPAFRQVGDKNPADVRCASLPVATLIT